MVMALSSMSLDLVPGELVDEADLVGVHEAGIAHHIAAVGEVDGEHGAAAVGDGGRAMVVQVLVALRRGRAHRGRGSSLQGA